MAQGCGDSNETSVATTTTNAVNAGGAKPVPSSLGQVESGAEDTIDFARARDRRRVVKTAHKLRRVADGPAAEDLRRTGVPPNTIGLLRDRARSVERLAPRGDFLQVSLLANQVSGLMPLLYAPFKDPVPPSILELDYLDRETQLRSRAHDRAAVLEAVGTLNATWHRTNPVVVRAGGGKVAATYSRHVAAMRRLAQGANERALQREAGKGLAVVDELEHVFQ